MPTTIDILTPEDLRPINTQLTAIEQRLTVLEAEQPPEPPDPPSGELSLQPIGGWRIAQPYPLGSIAIDHANRKFHMAGQHNVDPAKNFISVGNLPAHGTGTDESKWPLLTPSSSIPQWWPAGTGYANGLMWRDKLWVTPKDGYTVISPDMMEMVATDGETINIPLPKKAFAGFVKSPTGFEIGCGGYESGQKFAYGVTLGTVSGQRLIDEDQNGSWDARTPREPNYFNINRDCDPKIYPNGQPHVDSWTGLEPRNGKGRWCCDRVYGGGIRLSSGIYYWPCMATGSVDYVRQNDNFGDENLNKTYQYRYDPVTYQLSGWKELPGVRRVVGQDVSPDGSQVYLATKDFWFSEITLRLYQVG